MVKCPRCSYENNEKNNYCLECQYPLSLSKEISEENTKNVFLNRWKNFSIGKKVLFAFCIIFIIVLTFNLFYSLNVISNPDSNIVTTNKSSIIQSTNPYQVKVIYNGSWYGKIGTFEAPIDRTGYGNDLIYIDGASWDNVTVDVQKNDDSNKNLTVQILMDGQVIKENSTIKPNGKISLST